MSLLTQFTYSRARFLNRLRPTAGNLKWWKILEANITWRFPFLGKYYWDFLIFFFILFSRRMYYFAKHYIPGKSIREILTKISNFLRFNSIEDVYPNKNITLRIRLYIPARNCARERGFCCLGRVKTIWDEHFWK